MGKVLSIGEAAKLAGVSVQTLRHYDKLGLLAPSHVSAAGYRRYSGCDCERLQLIRALREVGFDLHTIGQLLASKIEPDDAIRMRFEALLPRSLPGEHPYPYTCRVSLLAPFWIRKYQCPWRTAKKRWGSYFLHDRCRLYQMVGKVSHLEGLRRKPPEEDDRRAGCGETECPVR